MATNTPVLPLLRLLQIADSAFPIGGFAYSHGLEALAARQALDEQQLEAAISGYIAQAAGRQSLPAALAAYRSKDVPTLVKVDAMLDASMAIESERNAGRLMGSRLLVSVSGALDGAGAEALRESDSPGQFAVAFAVVARDLAIDEAQMLSALGSGMAGAVTQAAVRLGLIGQAAATRLLAGGGPKLELEIRRVVGEPLPRRFGVFLPGLESASAAHPSLPFRMFAS